MYYVLEITWQDGRRNILRYSCKGKAIAIKVAEARRNEPQGAVRVDVLRVTDMTTVHTVQIEA